jgi:hypothetical protein
LIKPPYFYNLSYVFEALKLGIWEFASDEMALQKSPRNIVTSTFVEKVGTSAGS